VADTITSIQTKIRKLESNIIAQQLELSASKKILTNLKKKLEIANHDLVIKQVASGPISKLSPDQLRRLNNALKSKNIDSILAKLD
jgi:3-methyladenine DNA glycosylase/8-oxoguanine DNA glycosylase